MNVRIAGGFVLGSIGGALGAAALDALFGPVSMWIVFPVSCLTGGLFTLVSLKVFSRFV